MKIEASMLALKSFSRISSKRFLFFLLLFLSSSTWISHSQLIEPRLFGRSIPQSDVNTNNAVTKQKIVDIHNFYRASVDPPAADMLEMSWHEGAKESAQNLANDCKFLTHDSAKVKEFGSCGQNIFISFAQVDWKDVAKAWYMEYEDFVYGSSSNVFSSVGHYTQMVWYNSHKVGCGFRFCGPEVTRRPFYNYICNYCPAGNNMARINKPYTAGVSCGKCREHCKDGKFCTNTCPASDYWGNCAQLNATQHSWLCDVRANPNYSKSCKATCTCRDSII